MKRFCDGGFKVAAVEEKSRRPHHNPRAISAEVEDLVLQARKERRRAPPLTQPFAKTAAPNDTWCIDFKGKFRMQDGNWCHVLTLLDARSSGLPKAMSAAHSPAKSSNSSAAVKLSGCFATLTLSFVSSRPCSVSNVPRLNRASERVGRGDAEHRITTALLSTD